MRHQAHGIAKRPAWDEFRLIRQYGRMGKTISNKTTAKELPDV